MDQCSRHCLYLCNIRIKCTLSRSTLASLHSPKSVVCHDEMKELEWLSSSVDQHIYDDILRNGLNLMFANKCWMMMVVWASQSVRCALMWCINMTRWVIDFATGWHIISGWLIDATHWPIDDVFRHKVHSNSFIRVFMCVCNTLPLARANWVVNMSTATKTDRQLNELNESVLSSPRNAPELVHLCVS